MDTIFDLFRGVNIIFTMSFSSIGLNISKIQRKILSWGPKFKIPTPPRRCYKIQNGCDF